MNIKRNYVMLIVISVLLLSITTTIFASYNGNNGVKVVTVVDNQILLNDVAITSSSDIKLLPTLSPDGNKIAYLSISDRAQKIFDEIAIIDTKTNEIVMLSLENIVFTTALSLEWKNNEVIAFEGHINPSLNVYTVYNTITGVPIHKLYGIGFKWSKDNEHVYYSLPRPYFSDGSGNDKIMQDKDTVLYTSDSENLIIGEPTISADDQKFLFFERNKLTDETSLVVAEKNADNKFHKVKKIKWDKQVGEININQDNTINVENIYGTDTYDINTITDTN